MADGEDKRPTNKKRRANLANARASTGPRTQAGKTRSSKNALSHGLSAATKAFSSDDALAWGRRIAESLDNDSDVIVQLAIAVAAAQLEVSQVRNVRQLARDMHCPSALGGDKGGQQRSADNVVSQEMRLDRYERRALSRRKRALRELESALLRHHARD